MTFEVDAKFDQKLVVLMEWLRMLNLDDEAEIFLQ